jgi:hypothetical protein
MHDLTFASSGTNSLQSRMASGVQASRADWLPWARVPLRPPNSIATTKASKQMKRFVIFEIPNSDIGVELSWCGS